MWGVPRWAFFFLENKVEINSLPIVIPFSLQKINNFHISHIIRSSRSAVHDKKNNRRKELIVCIFMMDGLFSDEHAGIAWRFVILSVYQGHLFTMVWWKVIKASVSLSIVRAAERACKAMCSLGTPFDLLSKKNAKKTQKKKIQK